MEDSAYTDALRTLHDPEDTLRRRGLVTDAGADPGVVGAVGLLATPRLALDIDVAAGAAQVQGLAPPGRRRGRQPVDLRRHRLRAGLVPRGPVDHRARPGRGLPGGPADRARRTCPPTSTCPTRSPTRSGRRCAPAAPTWCRCWSAGPPGASVRRRRSSDQRRRGRRRRVGRAHRGSRPHAHPRRRGVRARHDVGRRRVVGAAPDGWHSLTPRHDDDGARIAVSRVDPDDLATELAPVLAQVTAPRSRPD